MGEISDIVKKTMAGRSVTPEPPEEVKFIMAMMAAAASSCKEMSEEIDALKKERDTLTAERDTLKSENEKMRGQLGAIPVRLA
jgi:regulator of replication initiation timing